MSNDYDDIIHLPHYEPKRHPRMSMMARAAQFAPFAAVAGHDAAIREAGRLTDEWNGMGECGNDELNRKMEMLLSRLEEHPLVTIGYFLPDGRKAGGSYQTVSGNVRRIDNIRRVIEFSDGSIIDMDMIKDLSLSP